MLIIGSETEKRAKLKEKWKELLLYSMLYALCHSILLLCFDFCSLLKPSLLSLINDVNLLINLQPITVTDNWWWKLTHGRINLINDEERRESSGFGDTWRGRWVGTTLFYFPCFCFLVFQCCNLQNGEDEMKAWGD